MIRSSAPRAVLRPLAKSSVSSCSRTPFHLSHSLARSAFKQEPALRTAAKTLAVTAWHQKTSLVRFASSDSTAPKAWYNNYQDAAREQASREKKLVPEWENVTPQPQVQSQAQPRIGDGEQDDVDMLADIKHDLRMIKQTFALQDVPRDAFRMGLAGVLPYLATASTTLALSFEINHAAHNGGIGYVMEEATANQILDWLEPIQIGYGAVILSFLGAIHWGLEWANYGTKSDWRRYGIGVVATAWAWPTVMFPVEYALIFQFMGFNGMYAIDATTTKMGWTPPWYASYRWVLTLIVGGSIVLSLIGRGRIQDSTARPSATDRLAAMHADGRSKRGE